MAVFNLCLTKRGRGGNPALRTVCVMTAQLPSASGYDRDGFPRPRTGNHGTLTSHRGSGGGLQPRQSDPARMLSGVLLLVAIAVVMALVLAWWLV